MGLVRQFQHRETADGLPQRKYDGSMSEYPSLLDPAEVAAAVGSLYQDQLKPFGRILRKRVAERLAQAVAAAEVSASSQLPPLPALREEEFAEAALPNVAMKQLLYACEASPLLRVHDEDGGDWSVELLGHHAHFVDVYDPADIYSDQLWNDAAEYFSKLAGSRWQHLPGGRYSCAQALVSRQLPFLAGLSLGRVCHIVQLAISQKKLLGYMSGNVVPYACSQSKMKEQRAEHNIPYIRQESDVPELPFATFDVACLCLKAIMGDGRTPIPLSNIKRLFRSRFQLDLSETKLGHSKLSELLQDERFAHICDVKLANNGYVVISKLTPNLDFSKGPPGQWAPRPDQLAAFHNRALPAPQFTGGLGTNAIRPTSRAIGGTVAASQAASRRTGAMSVTRLSSEVFELEPAVFSVTTPQSKGECSLTGSESFSFESMAAYSPPPGLTQQLVAKVAATIDAYTGSSEALSNDVSGQDVLYIDEQSLLSVRNCKSKAEEFTRQSATMQYQHTDASERKSSDMGEHKFRHVDSYALLSVRSGLRKADECRQQAATFYHEAPQRPSDRGAKVSPLPHRGAKVSPLPQQWIERQPQDQALPTLLSSMRMPEVNDKMMSSRRPGTVWPTFPQYWAQKQPHSLELRRQDRLAPR